MLQCCIGAMTRIAEMDFPAPLHPFASLLPDATLKALRDIPWLYPDFAAPTAGHIVADAGRWRFTGASGTALRYLRT